MQMSLDIINAVMRELRFDNLVSTVIMNIVFLFDLT